MNDKAMMQEVWRKAYNDPKGFTIPCANPATASKVRFALYNATAAFRSGKSEPDELLGKALANCQVTVDGSNVMVQQKLATTVSQTILAQLGPNVKTVEDYKAEESIARVMQSLEAPQEPSIQDEPTAMRSTASQYGARY